ncbi:MAG: hypothetical protein Q8Q31_05950 [Nanoarchaeota archaeon]|nr:hypothetical protein [Nanoarchaeota archaeon]
MSARELFLKAFVMNLIRSVHQLSKSEFNLGSKEAADESARPYISQEIPLLKIPEEILRKNYDNLMGHVTSTHEEDIMSKKIKNILNKNFPTPQGMRQNVPMREPPRPSQKRAPANNDEAKPEMIEREGYELTQIKFPRPVNVQEISSEGDNNTLHVGALDMERMSPSKDLPAPTKIRSMRLEPVQQMQRPPVQQQRPAIGMQPPRPSQFNQSSAQSRPATSPLTKPKQHPSILEELTIFGFAKLDELIQDPSVETIECPGPDKPILISRRGKIQPTSFALKAEEIDRIMKEISDKTRIPLTTGVFRAALRRYLVTAVLSEFVGTRFIIQKKPGVDNQ